MKKYKIIAFLAAFLLSGSIFGQGIVERYVRGIENVQTDLHFIYQGVHIPVPDITYHEFSADSITWRKNYVDGDCYVRFSNVTDNSSNPNTGLSGYHPSWWVLNFCTLNGNIGGGSSEIDTIFVNVGGVIDTVTTGSVQINITEPDTISGTSTNTQDTDSHTHELYIVLNDNEDVTASPTDGQVLKYNATTEKWVASNDLIGGGAAGQLRVKELDGSPSVTNVTEFVVTSGHLTNNGAGSVYLDLTLDPVNAENKYWRTDTVRVGSGDTFLSFSSALPSTDYIIPSLYAVLDNGNRQNLFYDSLTVNGFKVTNVVDSAWVHYLAIRDVDSLLAAFENEGLIYSTATDTTLNYLDQVVDDSTITVTNNDLTVLHSPNADSLGGVAASGYATYPFDTIQFNTDVASKAHSEGMMYFDSVRNNFIMYDSNDEVGLDVGKELWVDAYNNTGSIITNGQVVFIDTATTLIPTIELAKADLPTSIDNVIGLATHDIETGTLGRITTFGIVRGINTTSLTEGTRAWVSATTAGAIVDVRPEYPNYAIQVGEVLISDAADGQVLVNKTGQIEDILHNAWNGNILESFNFTIASNGSTITGTLDEQGSKDFLTMNFSDGFTLLDVSTPPTVTLTPGTDTNPQFQYIYIPESTKELTVSTTYWPNEEHIPIATAFLKSAATSQTDGAMRNQNINDHIAGTDQQGHISHMAKRIRKLNAEWESGTEASVTIVTRASNPDSVHVAVTGGMVWQMHLQSFPAQDLGEGDDIHVVNHPTNPYVTITDLNTQLTDAVSGSLSGRSFSFVVWGVQNKTGQTSHIMLNLPTGSYTSGANAIIDASGYSVYGIPTAFQGVGFLIARITMSHSTAGGGTWTLNEIEDLRGSVPSNIAGGSGGGGGGGITTFLGLSDTPSSYLGLGGRPVSVGASETALEFAVIDTTSSKINQTNFRTFINNAENDPVYAADSAGIVTFSDTASIVATKYDIDTITHFTTADEIDQVYSADSASIVWFADTTLTVATKYDVDTLQDNINQNTTNISLNDTDISNLQTEVDNVRDSIPNYETDPIYAADSASIQSQLGAKVDTADLETAVVYTKDEVDSLLNLNSVGTADSIPVLTEFPLTGNVMMDSTSGKVWVKNWNNSYWRSLAFNADSVLQTTLKDGLISVWEADETGGTTLTDAHGTNNGTTDATVNQVGVINKAHDYVSSSSLDASIPYDISLIPSNWTVSIWVNSDNTGSDAIFRSAGGSTETAGFLIYNSSVTGYTLRWGDGTSNDGDLTMGVSDAGNWVHLVATYDGTTIKVYYNGSYVTEDATVTFAYDATPSSYPMRLGRTTGYAYLDGLIDQVALWNRALSPSEISTLNNTNNGLSYTSW